MSNSIEKTGGRDSEEKSSDQPVERCSDIPEAHRSKAEMPDRVGRKISETENERQKNLSKIEEQFIKQEIENLDGEKILQEAVAVLPGNFREVCDAGLQGPPPVSTKELGIGIAKCSIVIRDLRQFCYDRYSDTKRPLIDSVMKRVETPGFILMSKIQGDIERHEQIQRPTHKDAELESLAQRLDGRLNTLLTESEHTAGKNFSSNVDQFLKNKSTEGKSFLQERDREEAKVGGSFVLDWIMYNTFADLDLFKELEEESRKEKSPVLLEVEQAREGAIRPTIILKKKSDKKPEVFVAAITKELGSSRIVSEDGQWKIEDVSSVEFRKILSALNKEMHPKTALKIS